MVRSRVYTVTLARILLPGRVARVVCVADNNYALVVAICTHPMMYLCVYAELEEWTSKATADRLSWQTRVERRALTTRPTRDERGSFARRRHWP